MKTIKKSFNPLFLLLIIIFLSFSILTTGCGGNSPQVVVEKKTVFKDANWNRFHYITHKIDIEDTVSRHEIQLEIEFLPEISTREIPIIFSITSPDSSLSHIRTKINLSENPKSPYTQIIHPAKYFNQKGQYTFHYFQKTSKFDLYGIKSVTMKIVRVPEKDK